jgi:hypothetical protein
MNLIPYEYNISGSYSDSVLMQTFLLDIDTAEANCVNDVSEETMMGSEASGRQYKST